jgi:hypothetical protein
MGWAGAVLGGALFVTWGYLHGNIARSSSGPIVAAAWPSSQGQRDRKGRRRYTPALAMNQVLPNWRTSQL